ncbi:hypothetical protein KC367_g9014 [Hortaea werneckii]|nr:hypothetical protein KC367_g9014 [Hortaea werneckii]
MSKWNVYAPNTIPDFVGISRAVGDYYESEEERAYAGAMGKLFVQPRNEAIFASGGNLVSLDILTIDPKFQRKGIGNALVQWGTRKADELGVEAVVESSVFGKALYEKNGFVFVRDYHMVSDDARWKDRPAGQFAWLVRLKKQEA